MRRAAIDLANLPDKRLFEEISEGITHIVENIASLNKAAISLYEAEEYRASEILRGYTEEEAAKVLILIDLVRCPRNNQSERVETLECFYDHLAKLIYAQICSYHIYSFEEALQIIEIDRRPIYLDGLKNVDWIISNPIKSARENLIYVDYVQDITEENGSYFWTYPLQSDLPWPRYMTPASVNVAKAIFNIGATTPKGLVLIADIWREFEPTMKTSHEDLNNYKLHTLERLNEEGLYSSNDSDEQIIMASWPFPLWPLKIRLQQEEKKNLKKLRRGLRRQRENQIRWIEETEAKRDPPLIISRDKVEALSEAYGEWEIERDEKGMITTSNSKIKKFRIGFDSNKLASFKKIERLFQELTEQERIDLLALAWFTRDRIANWPNVYERARTMVEGLNYKYQIGLGNEWLKGLERWEAKPSGFQPGQFY